MKELTFLDIKEGAEQGNADAQCLLGLYYEKGKDVDKDIIEAVKWFTKAAEQGLAEAQLKLAECYLNERDIISIYWLTKAAEQGNIKAQRTLALIYLKGLVKIRNTDKAIYWYTKAAEQGDADSQHSLANCYYKGEDVKKDYEKAFYWYNKSAEQNYAPAQHALSICYEEGNGIEKNLKKAHYWYNKATEPEDATAQKQIDLLLNNEEQCEIDVEIRPAIKALWKAGVKTIASCAGHKNDGYNPYIYFRKNDEFINYLTKSGKMVKRFNNGYLCYCFEREPEPPEAEIKLKKEEFLKLLNEYKERGDYEK